MVRRRDVAGGVAAEEHRRGDAYAQCQKDCFLDHGSNSFKKRGRATAAVGWAEKTGRRSQGFNGRTNKRWRWPEFGSPEGFRLGRSDLGNAGGESEDFSRRR